jgi:uncharacterized repeat protein (TIGR01451 family)
MKTYVTSAMALIAVVCWALSAQSQLDPRERYGTFLGGSVQGSTAGCPPDVCGFTKSPGTTEIARVVVDAVGNIYVAGHTSSMDFPTTSGAYHRSAYILCDHYNYCNSDDTFVAKFSAAGKLIWSTYLGINEGVSALALDTSGNIGVVIGSFHDLCGEYTVMLKINSTGSSLVYSNSLPCLNYNLGNILRGAAFDPTGRYIYVAISDTDGAYPPTSGTNPSNPNFPQERLVKIDTAKTTNGGIVYVAGTDTLAGAVTVNGSANPFVLGSDTAVEKFSSLGARVFNAKYLPSWATGSTGDSIALTSGGDVLFTAQASPQGAYPATSSFGTITTGSSALDILVVRLTGTTGSRVFSTAIHDAHMTPLGIARDSANEPFVTGSNSGYQYSVNRYTTSPSKGAFLLRLNSTGTKVWLDSTFGGDSGYSLAVDAAWNAYVVGTSNAEEFFPLTSNAYQSSFKSAASQGFLAKLIIEADVKAIQSASPNPVTHGTNLTYTLSVFNNGPDVSDGDTVTDVLPSGTTFVSFSTTTGTCSPLAVGSGGTFKCTRSTALNKGSYWGPVKLTVHVNAASGTTLKNTASVAAKTQDVFPSNNSATVYVKVQ